MLVGRAWWPEVNILTWRDRWCIWYHVIWHGNVNYIVRGNMSCDISDICYVLYCNIWHNVTDSHTYVTWWMCCNVRDVMSWDAYGVTWCKCFVCFLNTVQIFTLIGDHYLVGDTQWNSTPITHLYGLTWLIIITGGNPWFLYFVDWKSE